MQLDERNKYYQVLKKHEHNKDQVSKSKQHPAIFSGKEWKLVVSKPFGEVIVEWLKFILKDLLMGKHISVLPQGYEHLWKS